MRTACGSDNLGFESCSDFDTFEGSATQVAAVDGVLAEYHAASVGADCNVVAVTVGCD